MTYSGYLKRRVAYDKKPTVHAIGTNHGPQDVPPQDDLFGPSVEGPIDLAGHQADVWEGAEDAPMSAYGDDRISHDGGRTPPPPMGLLARLSAYAEQRRMLADHSRVHYRPDPARPYRHATQGRKFLWWNGRGSQMAGIEGPDFLVAGKNGFDFTNQPNEVYSAGDSNVGRYRLGVQQDDFGLYEDPRGLFGQEAWARALINPTLEYHGDRRRQGNGPPSAPFLPDAAFVRDAFQLPSGWTLGSETAGTDHILATRPASDEGSEFYDGDEMR
jgi:hypothetical protein